MSYNEKVMRKRKLIEKHTKELFELLKDCQHDIVEQRVEYNEGSYLDRASTDYYDICVTCGSVLNKRTKTHDYYG